MTALITFLEFFGIVILPPLAVAVWAIVVGGDEMSKTPKSYDVRCYELAELFLSDEPHLATCKRTDELAALIQQTIEGYITAENDNYDYSEPDVTEGAGYCENH